MHLEADRAHITDAAVTSTT
jgi:hypothetical protein